MLTFQVYNCSKPELVLVERTWQDYVNAHSNIEGARAAFEIDCAMLLRAMYPSKQIKIVRANPGDEGIDIYIGNIGLEPIEVYQCKFFLHFIDESQKGQIRESFNTAAKSDKFVISRWHLCVPLNDFDIEEHIWWDAWKGKKEKAFPLTIHLMNGNEIKALLKQHNLYNIVFKIEDSLRIEELRQGVKYLIDLFSPKFNSQYTIVDDIDALVQEPSFSSLFGLGYSTSYEDFYITRDSDDVFNKSLVSPKNIWVHGVSGAGKTITCKRNLSTGNSQYVYMYLNAGLEPKSANDLLELVYDNIYSQFEDMLPAFIYNGGNISKRIVNLLKRISFQDKVVICIDELPLTSNSIFKDFSACLAAVCADFASSCNGKNYLKFVVSTITNPNLFYKEQNKIAEFFTFIEITKWSREELATLLVKIDRKVGRILSITQTNELLEKSNTPRVIKSLLYQYVVHHKSQSFEKIIQDVLDKN